MADFSRIAKWAALAGGAASIAAACIISTFTGNGQPVMPAWYFAEGLFSGAGLVLVATSLSTIRRAN